MQGVEYLVHLLQVFVWIGVVFQIIIVNGSQETKDVFTQTKGDCNTHNGIWSSWNEWSMCSTSCGFEGLRYRRRKCFKDGCLIEVNEEKENCKRVECPEKLDYYKDYWQCYFNSPTHGGWTSWAVDDDCTSRCPGSIKYFSRKCNSPRPKYCGNFCGEETLMLQRCPIHGSWSEWSSWSSCCGANSYQTRSRSCNNPSPQYGGSYCVGESNEHRGGCTRGDCPKPGLIPLSIYDTLQRQGDDIQFEFKSADIPYFQDFAAAVNPRATALQVGYDGSIVVGKEGLGFSRDPNYYKNESVIAGYTLDLWNGSVHTRTQWTTADRNIIDMDINQYLYLNEQRPNFESTFLILVTYNNYAYKKLDEHFFFQIAVALGGNQPFAVYNYATLSRDSQYGIGYYDKIRCGGWKRYTSDAGSANLVGSSNIGVQGKHVIPLNCG